MPTHHEVLDCIAPVASQKFNQGDACGTDCGTAASAASFIIINSFSFVLCDVGYFFVAQSHSVDVSRWSFGSFFSFSFSHYFPVVLPKSLCDFLRVHLPRSFAVLIHVFVDLAATPGKVFCLFFDKFEEFVDVIFPSFSWSSNRSVGPVF